jgi:hypothetical protein
MLLTYHKFLFTFSIYERHKYMEIMRVKALRFTQLDNKLVFFYETQSLFTVLKTVVFSTTVFWDAKSCSFVESYRHFKGNCCIHLQGRRNVVNSTTPHGVTLILMFKVVITSDLTIISDPSPWGVTFRHSLVCPSLWGIFSLVEYTFIKGNVAMLKAMEGWWWWWWWYSNDKN